MTPEEALELFAAVPVGILSVTRQGVIRGGNFAAARLLDVPLKDLAGCSLLAESPGASRGTPEDRAALVALFEHGRFDERELPFVGPDGRRRALRASGRPLPDGSVAVIVRDPTVDAGREKRRLIELKMDALGRLASGVAHEYGNVMATLSGYAQLASHDPKMKDDLVEAVLSSAPRVRSVTDALRAFERVPSGEFEPFELASVAHRVVGILGPEIERAGARVVLGLSGRGPVLGQRAAVEEAVLAVVRNAVEACRGGGTVTISLADEEDERVVLSVSDTGPGIPEDFRDRVFDPFFTTKGSLGGGQYLSGGGGLGLGLAVAWNILRSHEGDIELAPQNGPGATFRLILPSRRERPLRRDVTQSGSTRRVTRRRPRRSILLVDPDPAARALVEAVLKGDHWVRAVATGQEGLDAYLVPRAFDYVILDVALKGPPSGADVLREIRARDPKARIVLLTQLASDDEMVRSCMPEAYALLRKPEGLKDVRDLLT